MRHAALARKLKRQARREYRKGKLDREKFGLCMAVAADEKALDELRKRIDAEGLDPWTNPNNRLVGLNFKEILQNIWDWFVTNWPTILRIILTIAPLLLLEPRYDED
jgi:hypothetical protein